MKVRGYLAITAAAIVMACEQQATPTATRLASGLSQSTGFVTNGPVQLGYQLDVPEHSAPVRAVVFGWPDIDQWLAKHNLRPSRCESRCSCRSRSRRRR